MDSASDRTMLGIRCSALLLALALAGCGFSSSLTPSAAPPDAQAGAPTLGDTRYSCGGPPGFLPSLMDQPANAELEAHPSAAALRAAIAQAGPDIDLLPASGYWLVSRDDRVAEYLARTPPGGGIDLASATIENQGGAWTIAGWGQCRPRIVLDGLSLASWVLDPDVPSPGADATTFTALVTEMTCTGGEAMGARLQPSSIAYGQDAVLVVFAARPLEGDAFDCQGNPSMRVVVQLREPLGERRLLDAGVFPPAEPVAPAF